MSGVRGWYEWCAGVVRVVCGGGMSGVQGWYEWCAGVV